VKVNLKELAQRSILAHELMIYKKLFKKLFLTEMKQKKELFK